MKRKNITVTETYKKDEIPCTLPSLLQWVEDRIVEAKNRGCVSVGMVELDTQHVQWEDYDEPVLIIEYERPETDKELKVRVINEKEAKKVKLLQKKLSEDAERKQYEKLKAKFEKISN